MNTSSTGTDKEKTGLKLYIHQHEIKIKTNAKNNTFKAATTIYCIKLVEFFYFPF